MNHQLILQNNRINGCKELSVIFICFQHVHHPGPEKFYPVFDANCMVIARLEDIIGRSYIKHPESAHVRRFYEEVNLVRLMPY